MRAQDGAEGSELDPSRIQLRIDCSRHVAADIVTPVGIPDVCCCSSEPRLESERIPNGDCVAGESDLVPMIAESAPTMEQQWTLAFTFLIAEVNVIQPPRRIHTSRFRICFLLPIEPPEIDAAFLQRMVQQVHVVRCELFVRDVERHIFLCRRIDAHAPRHLCISFFPRLYSRRRMEVQ